MLWVWNNKILVRKIVTICWYLLAIACVSVAEWNHLIEMVLLSTHSICFG